jgi:hypothetical protein
MNERLGYSIIQQADDADADWEENALKLIEITARRCVTFLKELHAVSDEQHKYGVNEAIETIEREFGL